MSKMTNTFYVLLMFEVDLKMCTQQELEQLASEASKKLSAYKEHGDHSDRYLNHIYLDFRSMYSAIAYFALSDSSDHRCQIPARLFLAS